MNDHSAGYVELPRTAYLDHTLRRARSAAEQRSHRYVTLEHLLLALLDDPDAVRLLEAVGADSAVIRSTIADAVNNRMASLTATDRQPPSFSYKFDAAFLAASEDALSIGRREVDGGLALLAVAKDLESNASTILSANGFHRTAALQVLATAAQSGQRSRMPGSPAHATPAPSITQRPQPQALPPKGPQISGDDKSPTSRPNIASHAASLTSGEVSMEDMLASVRNILEAEERKERGLPPAGNFVSHSAQSRSEPQLHPAASPGAHGQRGASDFRASAPRQNQKSRVEPSLGQAYAAPGRQQAAASPAYRDGLVEPQSPAFDFDAQVEPQALERRERRKAQRPRQREGRSDATSPLGRLLDHIPRKTRVAVPETITFRLSKEDAAMILGRPSRRGHPQLAGVAQPACRAVSVRLSAPEGGFFIEAVSKETQWIFDRPSFLGDEAFGSWAWTLIPSESGSFALVFSVSARDVDENGLAGDMNLPQQVIKVRVRGNFWRGIGRLIKTVFILLAGSGMTVGAYYALQMLGKIPR